MHDPKPGDPIVFINRDAMGEADAKRYLANAHRNPDLTDVFLHALDAIHALSEVVDGLIGGQLVEHGLVNEDDLPEPGHPDFDRVVHPVLEDLAGRAMRGDKHAQRLFWLVEMSVISAKVHNATCFPRQAALAAKRFANARSN